MFDNIPPPSPAYSPCLLLTKPCIMHERGSRAGIGTMFHTTLSCYEKIIGMQLKKIVCIQRLQKDNEAKKEREQKPN